MHLRKAVAALTVSGRTRGPGDHRGWIESTTAANRPVPMTSHHQKQLPAPQSQLNPLAPSAPGNSNAMPGMIPMPQPERYADHFRCGPVPRKIICSVTGLTSSRCLAIQPKTVFVLEVTLPLATKREVALHCWVKVARPPPGCFRCVWTWHLRVAALASANDVTLARQAAPPDSVWAPWYDVDPVLGDFLMLQSGILGKGHGSACGKGPSTRSWSMRSPRRWTKGSLLTSAGR